MSLSFNPAGHIYRLDGKRPTSVTTVLNGGVPKDLTRWAARTAATYAINNPGASLDEIAGAPFAERDRAGVRGTAIHNLAEQIIYGHTVEVPEELEPYLYGYVRFLDNFGVQPIATERNIGIRALNVAGRYDLAATIPSLRGDEPLMIDLKSSNGVYPVTKLQTAAYALADFETTDDDPDTELPLPNFQASYVAHITPEGTDLRPLATTRAELETHFELFKAAHSIYRLSLKEHRLAEPIPHPVHVERKAS